MDLERERRNVAVQQWDMLYGGVGQLDDLARMALRVAGEAQQAWAGTAVGQAVRVVAGTGVVRGGSDGSVGDGDTKHRGARRQSGGRDGCRIGRDDRGGGGGGGGGYRHTDDGGVHVVAVDGVEAKLLEAKDPGLDAGSTTELSMLLVGEGGREMGRETGLVGIDGKRGAEGMATDILERKEGLVVRRDEGYVLFLAERQKREVSLRFSV